MAAKLPMGKWIADVVASRLPGFERSFEADMKGHWFRRSPQPRLFSILVIQSSQKKKCFGVDVASTYLPTWNGWYGHHQMVAATGLVNLRFNSSITPMGEEYYQHDGTEDSVCAALSRISDDLRIHALPFFAKRELEVQNDPLISKGMAWLREREQPLIHDRSKLYFGRNGRLQAAHLPVLEELKSALRQECTRVGATKWQRQQTGILALHLLDYAQAGLLN